MDIQGIILIITSFLLWGLVPLFWKQIQNIPAFEIVNHRAVWTAFFLGIYIFTTQKFGPLFKLFKDKKKLASLFLTTVLISLNWGIFVWAVNSNHILDTSLGYYINPLLNILFGALVLKEKFSPAQKFSIFFAFCGVFYLVFLHGIVPWIALALAFSFGCYGLVRKLIPVPSDLGLTAEAFILFFPALIYLIFISPTSHFSESIHSGTYLFLGGLVTAIPLLLYLEGVRRIPYSTVGILQFLTPTTTFFLAIFVYKEDFDQKKLISFCFIWIAVIIYVGEIILKRIGNKYLKGAK